MKLPRCFNENQMEKTWEAFRKEYEIDVDAFRYAQSEFKDANKVLDKKIEYLKNTDNFINVRHISNIFCARGSGKYTKTKTKNRGNRDNDKRTKRKKIYRIDFY